MASRVKPQSPQSVAVPTLVPEGRHLGKSSMPLGRPVTLVGSRHRAHLHLLSRTVSKTHALLISTEAGVYVRDLASRTHVLVNGKSVLETFLHDGDRLAIGSFTFRFVDSSRNLPRHEATLSQCAVEVDGSSLAIAFEGRTLLIGRRSTCDITLTEPSVSICHAVIFELNGKHFIRDLGSRTGTFVNGNSIHQNPVAFGDTIRIGETEMRFVPAGQQTDIDELEDLVGTASLEEGSIPLLPAQRSAPPAPIQVTAAQTSADDLIPLASEDLTHDVAAPETNDIQVTTSAPAEPAEIDLASDPDVAGPNDTLPLPPTHSEAKAEPPSLSPSVVDHADSVDLHAEIHQDDGHSQLLVDANLHEERMTGSGTFVEVESESEELEEPAGHSVDIAAPADDLGLEFHDGVVTSEGPSADALPHPEEALQPPSAVSTHFDVIESPPVEQAPANISDAPVETREPVSIAPPTAVEEIAAEAVLDLPETHPAPTEEIAPTDEIEPIAEEPSITAPTTEEVASAIEIKSTVEEPAAVATSAEESAPVDETESITDEEQYATAVPLDHYPPATFSEPIAIEEVDLSSSDFRMGSQPAGEAPTDTFEELPTESEEAPAPLLGFDVHPPKAAPAVTPMLNASSLIPVIGAASLAAAADVSEAPASSFSSSSAEHDSVPAKSDVSEDAESIEPSEQEAAPGQIEEPISYVTESDETEFDESTEVIDATEPTPESAQELESAYPAGAPLSEDEIAAIVTNDAPLTDSTFGRDVQEFSGSGLGPLVEPLPASPAPEPSGSMQLEQLDHAMPASESPQIADGLTEPQKTHMFAAAPAPNVEPEFSFDDMAEQVLASEESLEEPMEFGEEIGFITEESPPISATPFDQHIEPTLDLTTPASDPLSLVAGTDSTLVGGNDLIDLEEAADAPLTLDEPEPSSPPSLPLPEANQETPPPPPFDPFVGMSRDSASFLGGIPIVLPPRVLPFAGAAEESLALSSSDDAVRVAEPHYAMPEPASLEQELPTETLISEPLETLTTEESIDFPEDGEETIGTFLSRLEASEPPAELFESTPDALDALPDSMGTLSEITDVLGDHAGPATISPLEKWDAGMPQLIDEAPGPMQWEPASNVDARSEVDELPATAAPESRAAEFSEVMPEVPPVTPAHPPHPRVPPPPRATRMRALSRPLNSEHSVTDGDPDSITIPPFEGYRPATEGQVTTAFDGLAMPPVREVDVFSQNLNPGLGAAFGAASAPPGSFGAATGTATAAGLVGLAAAGVDALSPPPSQVVPSRARRTGTGVAGSRVLHPPKRSPAEHAFAGEHVAPVVQRPTISPQFAAPAQPRPSRRRRLPLGWILPLMIIFAGASAAGIWYGVRSEGTAQASLRFENLEHLTEAQRRDFEKHERDLLLKPDLRLFARQIFENNLGGHGGAGLLYPGLAEEKAYSTLVDNATVPSNSQRLLIRYPSTDPHSDALRLRALVTALFRQNQFLADTAASLKSAWDKNDREVRQIHDRMDELSRSLADEQKAAVDAAPIQTQLDQLKGENAKLWKAWTDAAALMRDTQATIDHLELAGPVAPATTANGEPLKPDDDPQVKEFAARLKQIDTALAGARSAHNASADRANKSLDLALSDFQQKIMQAKANLKDGSELSSYLVAAQQAQDTIRQLNADLVERQKSEQQRLAELRRVLSEKQEARLKSVWAADPELKRMQDDLAVKEHRYNAAAGSGLNDDAKQLQAEIDDLKKQIDARRDLIGTGDIYADEVKDLQTFIDDNLKAMDAERARNDQRMQEQLKALAAAAPQIEKLPADQKAQAEEFEKRLADLNDARKQYAAAMATATPDSDEQVKKLETETTEMQAKLDARRKQLADENRKTLTRQQEEARLAALDEAKQKLTAARKAEEDSSLAVRANKENIDELQGKLDRLKAQGAKTAADVTLVDQLNATLTEKKSQADAEYQAMQQSPIPVQPTEEDVTVTELKDPRQQYILISLLGFAVTTLVLMVISRPGHEIPVADLAPLEEVEFEHDHASALEPRGPESSHSNGNGHSEDHPMAI